MLLLCRLLHAVSITQKHLRFWQTRLKAGSHGSFLLLSLGPLGFTADVLERLRLQNREQVGILASDRIEERVRNHSTRADQQQHMHLTAM